MSKATHDSGLLADHRRTTTLSVITIVVAAVLMFSAMNLARYTIDLMTTLLIYVAAAQAWNLLAGYGGQFSLGVALFYGTGSYATALVMMHLGMNPILAVGVAAIAAALLAAVLSPALLRLRGDYFSIGSLAATLAVQALVVNLDIAGKSSGIDVPTSAIPSNVGVFQLAVAVAFVAILVVIWTAGSKGGLQLLAIGQDQDAAVGLGVNVFRLRFIAFTLSALLTGAAGGVFALQQVHVEPGSAFSMSFTITVILMTIVGGIGTILGPIIGVVGIYLGLTQQLSSMPIMGLIIQGLVIILVVRFAPQGIWPLIAGIGRRFSPWHRGSGRRTESLADAAEDTRPDPALKL